MRSIDIQLWKCSIPAKGCTNNKIVRKIKIVRIVTMESTHGDEEKYKTIQFSRVQLSRVVLEK
jgi:hypothetical protein